MKADEAACESHIAGWLVGHGGHSAWKLGTQSIDFDPARELDSRGTVDVLRHGLVLVPRPPTFAAFRTSSDTARGVLVLAAQPSAPASCVLARGASASL